MSEDARRPEGMSGAAHEHGRARRVLIWAVAALVLAAVALYAVRESLAEEYTTFPSPDGKFKIVVYRYPTLSAMPGQSGDAPGYVTLYDERGRALASASVEMVQNVDQVRWEEHKVDVKLVAEWQLPR